MRVLVCGGRDYDQHAYLDSVLDTLVGATCKVLIHGNARGADQLAMGWALFRGIEQAIFPAHWEKDGKAAGHIRNQRMLDEGKPDIVIAFPGGRGTESMVQKARAHRRRPIIVRVE